MPLRGGIFSATKAGLRKQTPNSVILFYKSSKEKVDLARTTFSSLLARFIMLGCKFLASFIIFSIYISSIAAASLCSL